jgi:hypothetical protein
VRQQGRSRQVGMNSVVVWVRREMSGTLVSTIERPGETPPFVVDREDRRVRIDVLVRRAQLLAGMLGASYRQDLRWPCVVHQTPACCCPKHRGGAAQG